MTAYNFTDGSIAGQPIPPNTLPNTSGVFTRSNVIDFANQNLDSGNNDVASVINVPADTWVLGVAVRIVEVEADNAEMDIGYGSDYDAWTSTILEVDAGAGTGGRATTFNPVYFAAADTIDITNNNNDVDFDNLIVEVVALMVPGSAVDTPAEAGQGSTR
jgi:hypothetical protein